MDGVKGGAKEKRLAAQFIPKFFKHFPELADSAINAQLDLCEDEDVSVRIHAGHFVACCYIEFYFVLPFIPLPFYISIFLQKIGLQCPYVFKHIMSVCHKIIIKLTLH